MGAPPRRTVEQKPLSAVVADADGVTPPEDPDQTGKCRICGLDGPVQAIRDVFSNSFTSDPALSDGAGVCFRCEYFAGQMDYRRYHWVATAREGVRIIKERPDLLDLLLDPPEEPWAVKYKDGSDFLTVLNGWIFTQTLNRSRDEYRLLVDKREISIDRERFADMVAFGQKLRSRDDNPSKRALKGPVRAADIQRYDIERPEAERINNDLTGRGDWRIAVQLIQ